MSFLSFLICQEKFYPDASRVPAPGPGGAGVEPGAVTGPQEERLWGRRTEVGPAHPWASKLRDAGTQPYRKHEVVPERTPKPNIPRL